MPMRLREKNEWFFRKLFSRWQCAQRVLTHIRLDLAFGCLQRRDAQVKSSGRRSSAQN